MSAASSRSYHYSVGKRKTAIAQVRLFEDGSGAVTVNSKPLKEYFAGIQIENAVAPLTVANLSKTVDVEAMVLGGGKSAQSDAV
ncbi:30S ribosomal protein S9, partial [Candidatus Peribacteria bacterium RIFOXYD2_FULL_58_15]